MNSKNIVLRAARKYTRKGWRVVPIPHGKKAPRLAGWQKLRIEEDDLGDYFKPGNNLGVLLGKPSGGLVDIDLDCPQALVIGPRFLPETGRMHGRKTKPRSHYWYRVRPAPRPEKFCDPDGPCLLEIRSTGQQTIVPPSVHPSGERMKWVSRKRTARIDLDQLRKAAGKVAGASLFARHWPAKGSRNEAAMALAGTLLRADWELLEVAQFVSVVAKTANDEEWRARKAVALATQRRLVKRREATGRHRLSELLGKEVVDHACDWLGIEQKPVSPLRHSPIAHGWPKPLSDAAFHGLAGDIVRTIEPHSEADPAALLVQTLVGFGNMVGPSPFFDIESTPHRVNLFAILVGETAKSRKGTSWGRVLYLLSNADGNWKRECLASGMSSGEGLVWRVRDPIEKPKAAGGLDQAGERETVTADPGAQDKRLMAYESEFARTLRVQRREGNILSTLIRDAWDTGDLESMTKNSPAKATGSHISVIGHITRDELRRELTATDEANGFANRFLFVCVKRSKHLPLGGSLATATMKDLAHQLRQAGWFARKVGQVKFSENGKALWCRRYEKLSADVPGLLGAVTSRAEAQVLRLSMIYALLDSSEVIKTAHLRAALAVWRYCNDSARNIFGSAIGDPVADRILGELRKNPKGVTRSEIRLLFNRNRSEAEIENALSVLVENRLVRGEVEETGGRPSQRWFAAK